jgi:hypothetical protein
MMAYVIREFTLDLEWAGGSSGSINLCVDEFTTLREVQQAIYCIHPVQGLHGVLLFYNHRLLVGRDRTLRSFGIVSTTPLTYRRVF